MSFVALSCCAYVPTAKKIDEPIFTPQRTVLKTGYQTEDRSLTELHQVKIEEQQKVDLHTPVVTFHEEPTQQELEVPSISFQEKVTKTNSRIPTIEFVEQTRKESQQVPKVEYEKVLKYVPQVEYVDVELTRYEHVPRITYVDVPTRTFQHIPQVEYETRLLTVPRFGVEYQQHNRDVRYPVKQFWPEVVEAPKATSSY